MKGLIFTVLVTLAGCGQFQNVTVDQIRSDQYKRQEGRIALSIPQIQQAMYNYGADCRDIGPLRVNPSKGDAATYTQFMPGLTDMSASVLIDLRQDSTDSTQYKGYTYYESQSERVGEVIAVMSGIKRCKK